MMVVIERPQRRAECRRKATTLVANARVRLILMQNQRAACKRSPANYFSHHTPCELYLRVGGRAQTLWPALLFCVGGGIWETASRTYPRGRFSLRKVKEWLLAEMPKFVVLLSCPRRQCRDLRSPGQPLRRACREHRNRDAAQGWLADCRLHQHVR